MLRDGHGFHHNGREIAEIDPLASTVFLAKVGFDFRGRRPCKRNRRERNEKSSYEHEVTFLISARDRFDERPSSRPLSGVTSISVLIFVVSNFRLQLGAFARQEDCILIFCEFAGRHVRGRIA